MSGNDLGVLRILYKNWGLDACWTACSQVSTLRACNLADPARQRVWRSTGLGAPAWIMATLATSTGIPSVAGLALITHNLTTAATVTLKAQATDTDWGSPAFTTCFAVLQTRESGVSLQLLSAAQSYKYWRVEVTDAGNADGYYEVGVVYLSPVLSMAAMPNDAVLRIVDPSVVGYSVARTPYTFDLDPYVELELPFRLVTEQLVFSGLQDAVRAAGQKRDVVVSVISCFLSCSVPQSLNIYGRLADAAELAYVPVNLWDFDSLRVTESL